MTLAPLPIFQGRIRVEVLNGGGLSGVARDATAALRDLEDDELLYLINLLQAGESGDERKNG